MNPITLDEIETDFIAQMHALTPRFTSQQASGWVYHERLEPPSTRTRYFTLRWSVGDTFRDGLMCFGSEEVEVFLHVVVDYNLPDQDFMKIAWDDAMQLDDVFQSRKSPVLSGLMWAEFLSVEEIELNEGDTPQLDIIFLVRYLKARHTA